ncbi:hypothetical protein RFM99_17610 [Mesorhizobium sp. VK4C]|uniref:hypothetical protein n=1 Tax=Mesorhizobium captivum TaxID=3072319 RepID=UPI002A23C340|nr:hypothetical protein [Mesorhizobium sp. VK4C]MDX8500228.1 hypothetical protein [Mesorhizobium sp. VK4C]
MPLETVRAFDTLIDKVVAQAIAGACSNISKAISGALAAVADHRRNDPRELTENLRPPLDNSPQDSALKARTAIHPFRTSLPVCTESAWRTASALRDFSFLNEDDLVAAEIVQG